MICVAEKKSHLPGETAFGGAIPDQIKVDFDRLVLRAGWKRKRAIAAAIRAFVKAAESADKIEDSEAAKVYADVTDYYEEMAGTTLSGELAPIGVTEKHLPPGEIDRLKKAGHEALDARGIGTGKPAQVLPRKKYG